MAVRFPNALLFLSLRDMHNAHSTYALMAFTLLVLSLAACNQEQELPPVFSVSGEVTLDGEPMPEGEIAFVKVSEGIRDMLPIKDGKFEGGVLPGERKVEIRAYRVEKVGVEMYGDDAPESRINYIPPKYNEQSDLTATITESGPNEFKFEASSK